MGKKIKWFSTVKKALSPESKEKKDQKANRSKNRWFRKQKHRNSDAAPRISEAADQSSDAAPHISDAADQSSDAAHRSSDAVHRSSDAASLENIPVLPLPPTNGVNSNETNNDEQSMPSSPVEVATNAADEANVLDTYAAPEVVEPPMVNRYAGKSNEEVAAIIIQTAFRGYMARRALRALRGLVRLESLVQGPVVKRQANNTLRCMQTLARVQSQIRSRRIRMSEENQALQRQLLQKQAKELENMQMGEEWDDSLQSKEQIEASLMNKQEAARRRERALAYAHSHQQTLKNSSKTPNTMFMDTTNPTWGWSWLERWMAARPWENQSITENELKSDASSVMSAPRSTTNGEINKAYARHLNSDNPVPNQTVSRQSLSTPTAKAPSSSSKAGKLKSTSPRKSARSQVPDDDSKSMVSMHSERNRRHSVPSSSVRDNESQASSPSLPSYMVPTESAKAKSRLQSPVESNGTPEKESMEPVKKRLSYPASPARPRRHSGPPKVSNSSITEQRGKSKVESSRVSPIRK